MSGSLALSNKKPAADGPVRGADRKRFCERFCRVSSYLSSCEASKNPRTICGPEMRGLSFVPTRRESPFSFFLVRSNVQPDRLQRVRYRRLGMVEEYIHNNLGDPSRLTLDALAGVARLSRTHFHRLFRSWKGMTPHDFVSQERLKCAKRLLVESPEKSVANIATEVGCADQSHLCRLFKKNLGMTPTEFRRAAR